MEAQPGGSRAPRGRSRAAGAPTGAAFPERREELELYLESFRGVAGVDGRLPGDVDLVVEDVFADLIAHSRG